MNLLQPTSFNRAFWTRVHTYRTAAERLPPLPPSLPQPPICLVPLTIPGPSMKTCMSLTSFKHFLRCYLSMVCRGTASMLVICTFDPRRLGSDVLPTNMRPTTSGLVLLSYKLSQVDAVVAAPCKYTLVNFYKYWHSAL